MHKFFFYIYFCNIIIREFQWVKFILSLIYHPLWIAVDILSMRKNHIKVSSGWIFHVQWLVVCICQYSRNFDMIIIYKFIIIVTWFWFWINGQINGKRIYLSNFVEIGSKWLRAVFIIVIKSAYDQEFILRIILDNFVYIFCRYRISVFICITVISM